VPHPASRRVKRKRPVCVCAVRDDSLSDESGHDKCPSVPLNRRRTRRTPAAGGTRAPRGSSIGRLQRRLPAWCLAAHEARKPDADVRGPRAIAILQKAALLVFANAKPPDLSGRFSCCTDCRIRSLCPHPHRPMVVLWCSLPSRTVCTVVSSTVRDVVSSSHALRETWLTRPGELSDERV
jgi:hypothetical protein